jgi:hypothetical protein
MLRRTAADVVLRAGIRKVTAYGPARSSSHPVIERQDKRLGLVGLGRSLLGTREGTAAMQQVADWLKQLGLPEYVQRFVDNDIDSSELRHLTDQDLKELGVSLGHRRKMLASS